MICEMNNLEIESEVCVQPWCNPLWLTGLKETANLLTGLSQYFPTRRLSHSNTSQRVWSFRNTYEQAVLR